VRVRPRERLRVVRHVVTESVTFTVAVQREELRIERVPLDENHQPAAHRTEPARVGVADVGELPFDQDDVEVILHEERVVWSTEVFPVERVRLHVQTLTTQAQVGADCQVEVVDLVRDPPSAPDAP